MKRMIAITLGAMLLILAPTNLMAKSISSVAVMPRYAYISELSADCTCENGFATCFGAVTPWGASYDSQLSMTLQEYNSGNGRTLRPGTAAKQTAA